MLILQLYFAHSQTLSTYADIESRPQGQIAMMRKQNCMSQYTAASYKVNAAIDCLIYRCLSDPSVDPDWSFALAETTSSPFRLLFSSFNQT